MGHWTHLHVRALITLFTTDPLNKSNYRQSHIRLSLTQCCRSLITELRKPTFTYLQKIIRGGKILRNVVSHLPYLCRETGSKWFGVTREIHICHVSFTIAWHEVLTTRIHRRLKLLSLLT